MKENYRHTSGGIYSVWDNRKWMIVPGMTDILNKNKDSVKL